jgi:hypothetical protein
LRHAVGEVSVLRIGGRFFQGSEAVFSLIVFLLAAITIRAFRTITAVVRSTMSKVRGLVWINSRNIMCAVYCGTYCARLSDREKALLQ